MLGVWLFLAYYGPKVVKAIVAVTAFAVVFVLCVGVVSAFLYGLVSIALGESP